MKVFLYCTSASFLLFFYYFKGSPTLCWLSSLFLTHDTSLACLCFFPLCWTHISPSNKTTCCPYHECIFNSSFGFSSVIEQTLHYFVFFLAFYQWSQRVFSGRVLPVFFLPWCLLLCALSPGAVSRLLSGCGVRVSHCGGFSGCGHRL